MMWRMWRLNQERIVDNAFMYLKDVALDEEEGFDSGSEEGNNERKLLSEIQIEYQGTRRDSEICYNLELSPNG